MTENNMEKSKTSKMQILSLVLALLLLIGWNLIWLSTQQDSEGFHLMSGWGLMNDNQEEQFGFIPLMPLFILLLILLVLLTRRNIQVASHPSPLGKMDFIKSFGTALLIVGLMVLLPQLPGLGPDHQSGGDSLEVAEIITHAFGILAIIIPLFIIGLMFLTYQRNQRLANSGNEDENKMLGESEE